MNDDLLHIFDEAIRIEDEQCNQLRDAFDALSALITSSEVLAPVRNEYARRRYDLAVLERQREHYVLTGAVADIGVIRAAYAEELRDTFRREEVI